MNLKELHMKIFGNKENVIHDNVNRENGLHDDHDMLNITGLHTKFRTSLYKNVTENDELLKEDFVSYINEHFAIILIGDDIFKKDI